MYLRSGNGYVFMLEQYLCAYTYVLPNRLWHILNRFLSLLEEKTQNILIKFSDHIGSPKV